MTTPPPVPPTATASAGRLLRSTAIAALIAGAILVTVVLPAEYGVDPTRVGRVLGLTEMGEIKMRLAREDAEHEPDAPAAAAAAAPCPPATTSVADSVPTTPRGSQR